MRGSSLSSVYSHLEMRFPTLDFQTLGDLELLFILFAFLLRVLVWTEILQASHSTMPQEHCEIRLYQECFQTFLKPSSKSLLETMSHKCKGLIKNRSVSQKQRA